MKGGARGDLFNKKRPIETVFRLVKQWQMKLMYGKKEGKLHEELEGSLFVISGRKGKNTPAISWYVDLL